MKIILAAGSPINAKKILEEMAEDKARVERNMELMRWSRK